MSLRAPATTRQSLAFLLLLLGACCTAETSRLPLVECPATGGSPASYFVILLTGDGGWREIDRAIATHLNEAGVPVVGFLSNRYFRRAYDRERLARDVETVMSEYGRRFGKRRVLLVGYSRGADAIPVILGGLRAEAGAAVVGAVMLGPARFSELQVRRFDWLLQPAPRLDLTAEVARSGSVPLLCVQGTRERDGLCDAIGARAAQLRFEGGHHFGGRYESIAKAIVDFASRETAHERGN